MSDVTSFHDMCPHCGSSATRRLGQCAVCHRVVCEKCGSTQFSGGERRATHRECLKKDNDSFKMIKFVK